MFVLNVNTARIKYLLPLPRLNIIPVTILLKVISNRHSNPCGKFTQIRKICRNADYICAEKLKSTKTIRFIYWEHAQMDLSAEFLRNGCSRKNVPYGI